MYLVLKTEEAKGLKCDILHLHGSKLRDFLLLLQKSIEFYRDSIKKNFQSLHWYICPILTEYEYFMPTK